MIIFINYQKKYFTKEHSMYKNSYELLNKIAYVRNIKQKFVYP